MDENLECHLDWIAKARAEGVDLLLFPELSLTGYRLLHLTPRVALRPARSERIARLAAAQRRQSIILTVVGVLLAAILALQVWPFLGQ